MRTLFTSRTMRHFFPVILPFCTNPLLILGSSQASSGVYICVTIILTVGNWDSPGENWCSQCVALSLFIHCLEVGCVLRVIFYLTTGGTRVRKCEVLPLEALKQPQLTIFILIYQMTMCTVTVRVMKLQRIITRLWMAFKSLSLSPFLNSNCEFEFFYSFRTWIKKQINKEIKQN